MTSTKFRPLCNVPCRVCGGADNQIEVVKTDGVPCGFWVRCACGAHGPYDMHADYAFAAWCSGKHVIDGPGNHA